MNFKARQTLLAAILLGGHSLVNSGCGTPTTSIGVISKSDRTVVIVSTPVPTRVQCAWQQDGARVRHEGTTPFRLAFPSSSVREVNLSKPAQAAGVAVTIRPAGAERSQFVMGLGSCGMRLVSDGRRWEGRRL